MPAVQLIQLKQQINALAHRFDDPAAFRSDLEALLIRYADLTYKPGQEVRQSSMTDASFRTAPIVLSKLEQRMAGLAEHYPDLALAVSDSLWETEQTEMRYLSAVLLGNLPAHFSLEVLDRLKSWTLPGVNYSQVDTLFIKGSARLRHNEPQKWLDLIRTWVNSPDEGMVRVGVMAVSTLASDDSFENLPAIYNIIGPVLSLAADDLQLELRNLLIHLARRSPTETGYFLRQVIGINPTRTLMRVVRRIMPEFPEEIQNRLRGSLAGLPRE